MLLIIKKSSFPKITILGQLPDSDIYRDVVEYPSARILEGILIVKIEESLFFANIEQIRDMFSRLENLGHHLAHPTEEKSLRPLAGIIIHARHIEEMDLSAIQTISEMMAGYESRKIFVCFVKLQGNLTRQFLSYGIIGSLGGDRLFDTIKEAVLYINSRRARTQSINSE